MSSGTIGCSVFYSLWTIYVFIGSYRISAGKISNVYSFVVATSIFSMLLERTAYCYILAYYLLFISVIF